MFKFKTVDIRSRVDEVTIRKFENSYSVRTCTWSHAYVGGI